MLILALCSSIPFAVIIAISVAESSEKYAQFPYMATIRAKENNGHLCGGAILNNYWIASAAHCFIDSYKLDELFASVGLIEYSSLDEGINYDLQKLVTNSNERNDIALLKTSRQIEYQPKVNFIPFDNTRVVAGDKVRLLGYGTISRVCTIVYIEIYNTTCQLAF